MNYIGIDIGGTRIKGALLNEKKEIQFKTSIDTESHKSQSEIIHNIVNLINILKSKTSSPIAGIGISCPGRVDYKNGIILGGIANVPSLAGTEIVKQLSDICKTTVKVDNDANCAAMGEYYASHSELTCNMLLVTLGTGIGGGIIIDRNLYRGSYNYAGEIGHTVLIPDGIECTCGNLGCLEAYTSSPGILRRYRTYRFKGIESSLNNVPLEQVDVKLICEHVRAEDRLATEIIDQTGFYLGTGLSNAINLLDIEDIVIGGEIANSLDLFLPSMKRSISRYTLPLSIKHINIRKAILGNDAGIIGAARLLD